MPIREILPGAGIVLLATVVAVSAAGPAKRARPPQFSKEVTDAFFSNALETLVGPRPQRLASPPKTSADEAPASTPAAAGGAARWPELIDADALESEIKAQHRALGQAVDSALKFKGGQYQDARVRLSVLAAMFALVAEYGQPVRWQREAASLRDQLAQSAANCKVGSDASYQSAKARFEELALLVRGESVDAPPADADVKWPDVANRAMLMKRLEQSLEGRLSPGVANARAFAASEDELRHESQIVAALAAVIAAEGYEYAADESYREWAAEMRSQAAAAGKAIAEKNYESTRRAIGNISKSCAGCHEGFRN